MFFAQLYQFILFRNEVLYDIFLFLLLSSPFIHSHIYIKYKNNIILELCLNQRAHLIIFQTINAIYTNTHTERPNKKNLLYNRLQGLGFLLFVIQRIACNSLTFFFRLLMYLYRDFLIVLMLKFIKNTRALLSLLCSTNYKTTTTKKDVRKYHI